jgi:hypothetical protein
LPYDFRGYKQNLTQYFFHNTYITFLGQIHIRLNCQGSDKKEL